MTVSKSKDVNLSGLNSCANSMRQAGNNQLSFYVVVPSIVFSQFTTVRLRNDDRTVSANWPQRFKDQWVLKMPILAKKRTRVQLQQEAKETVLVQDEHPDAMAVDELVATLRHDEDLESLERDGIEHSKKKYKSKPKEYTEVAKLPKANPAVWVFQKPNRAFVYSDLK
jgi:hypothetical protein